jgi:hypothetical protein
MAKFNRFDPRNKKANKHKQKASSGSQFKRIKEVVKKGKAYYETEAVRTQGD